MNAHQRRVARRARLLLDPDAGLPEGLSRAADGSLMFDCNSCGEPAEWPAAIEDFDINNYANMCGRSPNCCL